ncbi:MAG: hypothetical protein K5922_03170 [Clostridiales bacterium]|nr:hypothetical protein [Clostridiales bacterium]
MRRRNAPEVSLPKLRTALGRVLLFLAVALGFFAWWLSMLLLVSLVALNTWRPLFTDLLCWSGILSGVCSAVWLAVSVRRRR